MHSCEKQTLSQKRRTSSKEQFLTSRFLAKAVSLSNHFNDEWSLRTAMYDEHLNTFVVSERGETCCELSISHSHEYVALLEAPQYKSAVDIQHHNKPESSWQKLVSLFHADDQMLIDSRQAFFDSWAIKEAYAKLKGLSVFEVLSTSVNSISKKVAIHTVDDLANYSVAIASTEVLNPFDVCRWEIHFPKLICCDI